MSSGASKIYPVEMEILPSSQVHRGMVSDVPLDQLDHATLTRKFSRGMDREQKEVLRSGLTLEEVRWSSMRRKIPGMSAIPKTKSKMYVDLDPHTKFMKELKTFVRQHFHQKECSRFVPAPKQRVRKARDLKCKCGEILTEHAGMQIAAIADLTEQHIVPKEIQNFMGFGRRNDPPPENIPDLPWDPSSALHTTVTNGYGKINFVNVEHVGGKKPAKYIRMTDEDSVEDLIRLMIDFWKIMEPKAPNLVISVVGGAKNFKLDGRMRDTFSTGLIKAAKTTSAWLISSGFNMGVMKSVGQAVRQGQSFAWDNDRMAHVLRCIGIAPWGYVKKRRDLESPDENGKFYADYRTSNVILHGEPVPLNPDHTHFIFVDDGYRNRYGGVAGVRAKFEQRISQPKTSGGLGIPVVLVVVEGGTDAIADAKKSLEHKIPVVVCSGTGRAADILAYAYSHTKTMAGGWREMKEKHETKLREKIYEAYGKSWKDEEVEGKTDSIASSVKFCCRNADLVCYTLEPPRGKTNNVVFEQMIVFNMNKHEDLDLAILTVLLKAYAGADESQRLSQLKLALTWNRVDIAQEEIFREDVHWKQGSLDEVLTIAIQRDKVKFMELILQQGVFMKEYLTIGRMEQLYSKVPKHSHIFTLMNKMTGRDELNRENIHLLLSKLLDRYDDSRETLMDAEIEEGDFEENDFKNLKFVRPYKQLMIWAVLLNRQKLAKFCWEMGDEPVTSALAATRLYSAMARNIGRQDSVIKDQIVRSKLEFEELATSVINECHHKDPNKAMMIVERKSPTWNDMTCLQIAASSNDQIFLSSVACQNSINTTWKHGVLGSIKRVMMAVFFPPVIMFFMEIESVAGEKINWFQKLLTFYTSPVSKFTYGTIWYIAFLILHSYMVLVDFQPTYVTPIEIVCQIWILAFLMDDIHTFIEFPAPTFRSKIRDWYGFVKWLEFFNYLLCFIGFVVHLSEASYMVSKVIYCINAVIFYIRIMKVYTASSSLGPKLVMIKRMLEELRMFIMVLLVFLLAYGISSQGLLYHSRSPSWDILKDVIYFPYWQLYGEIFLEEIETEACDAGGLNCRTFHWLVPFLLAAYLLVGNVLLLNLLIAIFSHVFDTVEQNSIEIWKYEMYFLVMEYDKKTAFVPPFSIVLHILLGIRWLVYKICRKQRPDIHTFGKRHLEYLQLFEKEMTANYLRRQKEKEKSSLEMTVSRLQKRVDELTKLIEDEVIGDQAPNMAGTMLYTRDGQLVLPRVDTGLTMAPAWPSAKKVLDVKEQVASSEIPAEYFHKSPPAPELVIIPSKKAQASEKQPAKTETPAVKEAFVQETKEVVYDTREDTQGSRDDKQLIVPESEEDEKERRRRRKKEKKERKRRKREEKEREKERSRERSEDRDRSRDRDERSQERSSDGHRSRSRDKDRSRDRDSAGKEHKHRRDRDKKSAAISEKDEQESNRRGAGDVGQPSASIAQQRDLRLEEKLNNINSPGHNIEKETKVKFSFGDIVTQAQGTKESASTFRRSSLLSEAPKVAFHRADTQDSLQDESIFDFPPSKQRSQTSWSPRATGYNLGDPESSDEENVSPKSPSFYRSVSRNARSDSSGSENGGGRRKLRRRFSKKEKKRYTSDSD